MSEKDEGQCALCKEAAKPDGPENLVVYRGKRVFLILNRFPYTNGHIMVVPFEHCSSIEQLDSETMTEMMEMTSRSLGVLRSVYRPEGYNIGMNIGEAAGAGIADHVHIHVVPRWGGDTNFMSTLAGTRVLPEALEDTFKRIKKAWKESQ